MSTDFDPYRKWLGIPKWEQPANHYRLLGINLFEHDPDVIEAAADRQMAHIRNYQAGQHSAESQTILNELSAARICLLSPDKKKAYDQQLRTELAQKAGQVQVQGPPFGFFVKGAARYFLVQWQRFRTAGSVLPAAYVALGEEIVQSGRYREKLADLHAKLDSVASSLDAVAAVDQPPPAAEEAATEEPDRPGFFARLKTSLQGGYYRQQRQTLLRRIGQEAYRADAMKSGPAELVEPVRAALARAEELRHEVELLSEVPANTWLSPKRLAWIVLAIAGTLFFLFLWARWMLA